MLQRFDKNSIRACVFIAGYVSFKIKIKLSCSFCAVLIKINQITDNKEVSLIAVLDRES